MGAMRQHDVLSGILSDPRFGAARIAHSFVHATRRGVPSSDARVATSVGSSI